MTETVVEVMLPSREKFVGLLKLSTMVPGALVETGIWVVAVVAPLAKLTVVGEA